MKYKLYHMFSSKFNFLQYIVFKTIWHHMPTKLDKHSREKRLLGSTHLLSAFCSLNAKECNWQKNNVSYAPFCNWPAAYTYQVCAPSSWMIHEDDELALSFNIYIHFQYLLCTCYVYRDMLGMLSILPTNFWWSHQTNHKFQIANFSVSSHQNVLYNSVAIPNLIWLSQNYIAHLGNLKQQNWWFGWWLHQKTGE